MDLTGNWFASRCKQGNKADSFKDGDNRVASLLSYPLQLLGFRETDWHDHSTAFRELIKQGLRYVRRCGGDNNGMEGSVLRQALRTVPGRYRRVAISQSLQSHPGPASQGFM